jgi:hypothetical protein
MIRHALPIAAIAMAAAATFASPASAGSPCCCVAPCVVAVPAPPVLVYEPFEMPRVYIVDQGPVYSGPGIYTNPTVVLPRRMPRYPYVGRDYPNDLPPYVEPIRSRAQYVSPRRAVRYYK